MATGYRKYILSTGTHWISNRGSDENGNINIDWNYNIMTAR